MVDTPIGLGYEIVTILWMSSFLFWMAILKWGEIFLIFKINIFNICPMNMHFGIMENYKCPTCMFNIMLTTPMYSCIPAAQDSLC